MKQTIRPFWCIFFLLLGFFYSGFAQHYNFRVYSLSEGLPQSEVKDILQDKRGAIWVATNGGGVCRFNGLHFKVFNQQNGLSNNRIRKIFEDRKGNLWFVTEGGISCYNGLEIKTYTQKNGFPDGNKFQIIEDRNGVIWVYAQKEQKNATIVYFDSGQFVNFSAKHLNLIQNNYIQNIQLSPQKDVVISTQKGIYEFKNDRLSFSFLNQIEELKGKQSYLYMCDSQGRYWLSTNNTDLYVVSKNTTEKIKIPQNNNLLKSPSFIYEDPQGEFWFVLDRVGLCRFSKKLEPLQVITKENNLPTLGINRVMKDKEGNLWLGTNGYGLIKYEGDKFVNFNKKDGLESDLVWSFLQDKKGVHWFGTDGEVGLARYDGKEIKEIKKNAYLKRVKKIIEIPNEKLLIASHLGIWEYDTKNDALENVSKKYGFTRDEDITTICQTDSSIWFGTYQNGIFEHKKDILRHFDVQTENLVSNAVNHISEDKEGSIWIATNYGVSKWDGTKMVNYGREQKMPSEYTLQTATDKYNNVWMATLGGLVVFEQSTKKFKIYGEKQGLISNTINSILIDTKDQIWVGTQKGISRIQIDDNKEDFKIKNFGKSEGFIAIENKDGAIYEDQQGYLWFGTVMGAVRYQPNLEAPNEHTPIVNINNIRLFFQGIDWKNPDYQDFHQGISPWLDLPKQLSLSYSQNHISFDFEALSYQNAEGMKYSWFLEGVDKTWSPLSNKNEAVYPNLPPSSYVFKIRACNGDGKCSEVVEYPFAIQPAFWQSVWFQISIILFVGIVIFAAIRQRIRAVEKQKRILEEKVTEAKAEVLQQNQELLKKQEKIESQRKSLQELNATKDRFFSILAHDIKGPLNSLTAFLNIMNNHLDEMSKEDIQFMSDSLNRSVKNLYSLLENVLSWSRSQMGVLQYTPEDIILYDLIENNCQLLDVTAHNKTIELQNKALKEIIVSADNNSLNTVMRNLISNAIKFTPQNGKITISTILEDNFAKVCVEDTGVGMSEDVRKKIFQIDKRHTTKGTANEVGTGLGLILCKEFVEKNGGKIWVESEEGKGSRFFFQIPVQKEVEKENKLQENNNT